MRKRSISILLILCLVLSLLPCSAFAEETETREDGAETENVSGEAENASSGTEDASGETGNVSGGTEDSSGEAGNVSGETEDDSTKPEPPEPEDPANDGAEPDGGPAEPVEDDGVSDTPSGAVDGALPTAANTPDSGTCGANVTWSYTDGTLTIAGSGPMEDYAANYRLRPWENYHSQIQTITIGSGVTTIGASAFCFCQNLTSVAIPNSVTSIGKKAFQECRGLTGVAIPSSVASIGEDAFNDCSGLTSVTIPNSVTSIGAFAFSECSKLTSVTIPNSITSIGMSVFSSCTNLTSVTIPESVTSIGVGAFDCCSKLASVKIPNSVTSIGSSAFGRCHSLTSIVIPSRVTSIEGVFFNCENLTNVTIPGSVTNMKHAFDDCTSLASVAIPNSVTNMEGAFYHCSSLTSVIIPNNVTTIDGAFTGCSSLTRVAIPGSVTSIGGATFRDCTSLTSVSIPGSITHIGNSAFDNCSSLTRVNIPGSVTLIENYAFRNCVKLTGATVPSGVTWIGSCVFENCSSLAKVSIPISVESISDSAFKGCSGLRDVHFQGSESQWKAVSIKDHNEPLYSATMHYNSYVTPEPEPEPSDSQWLYVQNLTKNSLARADEETKTLLNLAIYNLLFKAYFRPVRATNAMIKKIKNTPPFPGAKDNHIPEWPLQNNSKQLGKTAEERKRVKDPILGEHYYGYIASGCMSYAGFASAYTYGTGGNPVVCKDRSANGIKAFFHECADPGEHIRYENPKDKNKGPMHSVVFLGEDNKGEGFYYISYGGGVYPGHETKHDLYVAYQTYVNFATKVKNLQLSVYDTNGRYDKTSKSYHGASYCDGTAKPVGDVRVANKKNKRIEIACPVEAVVQYKDETLDSSLISENQIVSASFGTVTRDAEKGIVFDLDPNIDYDLKIVGTGNGNMNLTLEYYDETGVTDSRKFEGYPITESTTIQTSGFDPLSGFALYGEDGSGEPTVWGAGIGETVTAETAQDTAGLYSGDNNIPATEILLDVDFVNGDFDEYFIETPFTDSVKEAYVVAALYEGSGKLREIVQQKVQDDGDAYNLSFKNALAETDSVKVLLLDQSYKPLREAHKCSLTADTE